MSGSKTSGAAPRVLALLGQMPSRRRPHNAMSYLGDFPLLQVVVAVLCPLSTRTVTPSAPRVRRGSVTPQRTNCVFCTPPFPSWKSLQDSLLRFLPAWSTPTQNRRLRKRAGLSGHLVYAHESVFCTRASQTGVAWGWGGGGEEAEGWPGASEEGEAGLQALRMSSWEGGGLEGPNGGGPGDRRSEGPSRAVPQGPARVVHSVRGSAGTCLSPGASFPRPTPEDQKQARRKEKGLADLRLPWATPAEPSRATTRNTLTMADEPE